MNPVELAIKQAEKVTDIRTKHGAVLMRGNKVVAVGHNRRIRPRGVRYRETLHAEEVVLSKIRKDMDPEDLTLIVVRINRWGHLMSSKPCVLCQRLIERAGVGKVVHS